MRRCPLTSSPSRRLQRRRGPAWCWLATALLLLAVASARAYDLGVPQLRASPEALRLFERDRLLTTGGVKYAPSGEVALEPEVGLGHQVQERSVSLGRDAISHRFHAQAGGKVTFMELISFSAAAKLPLYTAGKSGPRFGGGDELQGPTSYQSYDLFKSPGSNLSWTSEIGVRLGRQVDLNLFYDQSRPDAGLAAPGALRQREESFGTRINIRFK